MKAVTWDVSAQQESVLRPPRGGPATIAVRDLRKSYGDLRAVDGVTFEVGQGEFFGILGPNGAGKTTTLEIIEGLRQPDGGEVSVLDMAPWPRNPALLPRIGVQLQASSFFEHLTAREQLRTFAALYGVPAGRADDMLEVVGMSGSARRSCPAGRRSGCPSPARSCTGLKCCSWTSRPGRLTRRPDGTCGTCCGPSARKATRWCSPRTTWTRPRRSASGWPSWTTARSSRSAHPRPWSVSWISRSGSALNPARSAWTRPARWPRALTGPWSPTTEPP